MRPFDPKTSSSAMWMFPSVMPALRSVPWLLRPRAAGAFLVVLFCLSAVIPGCAPESREEVPRPETPPVYDAGVLERAAALADSGYALLGQGEFEEALAVFRAQTALVPRAKGGLYNQACAHCRSGRQDKGMELLTQAVEAGWDDPRHMEEDPDLEPLKADPSFADLVQRAGMNRETRLEWLRFGLPEAEPFPGIEDEGALQERVREGWDEMRRHRGVWHTWQQTTAQVMLAARELESERAWKSSDPEFDYELERVRTLAGQASIYQPWGPITDGVEAEAAKVLAVNPVGSRADEAHYLAGMAVYGRELPQPGDERWVNATGHAIRRFDMISKDSEWASVVAAWRLWFDLGSAQEDRKALYPRLREFHELHAGDSRALSIAAAFFQDDLVLALWPLPFEAVDIDGEPVDLDQYKGKVLLLDFWATWCGPCLGELPHMREAYERFHKDGFEILSVSLDYEQNTSVEAYRSWVQEEGMVWRHVYDLKNWDSPLAIDFFVTGIPSPFLIGRDGSLVASGGALRGENLVETIGANL